jgi:hypothetical protein
MAADVVAKKECVDCVKRIQAILLNQGYGRQWEFRVLRTVMGLYCTVQRAT